MLKHTEEAPQRTSKKKLHTDEEEEEEALPTWHSHELGTRRNVPLN
jgi:hypothetical protein